MKFANFCLFLVLGCVAGLAVLELTGRASPLDDILPRPEPAPYVVHERPVTTVEMVVGLAGMLVEAEARADRLERERDALRAEATEIIRTLVEEIERLGGPHPPGPPRPEIDV